MLSVTALLMTRSDSGTRTVDIEEHAETEGAAALLSSARGYLTLVVGPKADQTRVLPRVRHTLRVDAVCVVTGDAKALAVTNVVLFYAGPVRGWRAFGEEAA